MYRPVIAIALALCAGACTRHASPLVDGLAESENSTDAFARRVSGRYPAGTPVRRMREDLESQGFDVQASRATRMSDLPSVMPGGHLVWVVEWRATPAGTVSFVTSDVRYESQ